MSTIEQKIEPAEELISLLTQQQNLYQQLHKLACQQTVLVDGKDPEMLLKVLASRQRLINQLSAIDKQLKPMRENWDQTFNALQDVQKRKVQVLLDDVKQTLSDIIQRDQRDTEKLNVCKQQVAQEISGVNAGRKMNNVYGGGTSQGITKSRYFDMQSE